MKVRVHELKHKINVLIIASLDDIQQLDYILVAGEGLGVGEGGRRCPKATKCNVVRIIQVAVKSK